jgi:two-component sensor histidine kinase/ligand-binding sensor domain-containing protein
MYYRNQLYQQLCLPLLMLFICTSNASAQQFNFKSYSLEDGLSQSEVNCIFQDSRGYIWAGTSGGGLCKFDGKEFTSYETENGLAGQIITDIEEDQKGNLWITSTWGGVSKFDGKVFKVYDYTKGLSDNYTTSVLTAKNGNIYIGTGNGICYFENNAFRKLKQPPNQILVVSAMLQDKNGNIWVGTTTGVYQLLNQQIIRPANAITEPIQSMALDKENQLNILTSSGKFFVQTVQKNCDLMQAIDITQTLPKLDEDRYYVVYIDHMNRKWLGTFQSGVVCMDKGRAIHYDDKNGLKSSKILAVLQDKSGTIWLGSKGLGLIKFRDRSFTYFDDLQGLNFGEVFCLQPDTAGHIWVGTHIQGLYRYDGKEVVSYTNEPLLKRFNIRAICVLRNSNILIGGSRGIRVYNGKRFSLLPGIPDEPRIKVSAIHEDKNGDIWIGTFGQGLFLYKKGKLKCISNIEVGHVMNIYCFSETKNNLLVGTGEGIFVADSTGFRPHAMRNNLCNAFIGSMAVDQIGRVWIGTDKCVSMWDGKKFSNYGVQDGFASGTVYSVVCDKQGNIWVGTNKGVDRVTFGHDGAIERIKNFGYNDGFKGVECNSRSVCVNKNGDLYFGTIKGVIRFSPSQELPQITFTPDIQIESFKVNFNDYSNPKTAYVNYWYRLPQNPRLSNDIERISFTYSAINPTFPIKMKYSFKLEGYDKDWSPWSSVNASSYSALSPGHYVFKVKAMSDSHSESKIVSFPFEIKTPFYLSFWFFVCSIIIIIYVYYLLNNLRKSKAKRDLEALEKIISERTYEIQKQSEEKEILLKEIHHRVKNNLQVINSLINIQSSYVEDEKSLSIFEECKNRIRTISLIHEKLYKSYDFKKINFNDYLVLLIQDLVKSYNVDKQIELKTDLQIEYFNLNTIVPLGLLLNEIISNSLKYAFNNVEKGIISISLKEKGFNQFELIIGDNGKGYEGEPNKPNKSTLGLELIRILTDQLDGHIIKLNSQGTVYKLDFKLQKN